MPISEYFKGHGQEVMSDMKKRYGKKKGEQVFYATANRRDQNPSMSDSMKDDSEEEK